MKVVVWGCGQVAMRLLDTELKNVNIEYVIDNNPEAISEYEVVSPVAAVKRKYDIVIVSNNYAKEVYAQAVELGYDMSKFVFIYNNFNFEDMNRNYELAERVFSPAYINTIKNRYHVVRGMVLDQPEITIPCDQYHDYNRLRTFKLVVDEIKANGIEGQVAELGVFRGDFAKYINEAFPDRKCYLFDTFEGFREDEGQKEKKRGNVLEADLEFHKRTTIEMVMEKMSYPEQIICKKGLFPESLHGLEDTFSFVSIDVDFEQAIYDGISYFYPRLCSGGYIFIHDYNSRFKGVREAIKRYEIDNGIRLAKVPIPDADGSVVLAK